MTIDHSHHKVHIHHDFAVPAEALWAVLGDFTNLSWVPAVPRHEFEGEGVGTTRRMFLDDTFAILERLEALDGATRTMSYSIPENNPLPCTDYYATMTVVETGPDTCRLEWGCTFEPLGMSDEDAVANITQFYWSLIPGIEASVGSAA
jgi:hypothetical protein